MWMDLDMPTRMPTSPFRMCKETKAGERGNRQTGHQSGARVICKWNSGLLILFVTPAVSLYLMCALFAESMVDKVQAGRLEENSRNHRNCRCDHSAWLAQQPHQWTRCILASWG